MEIEFGKDDEKKLTAKQEMFCQEFIVDLNASRACVAAGYSESSAKEIGSENLTKPNISKRIKELMTNRMQRVGLRAEEIVAMVYEMATTAEKEETRLKAMEMLMKHTGAYILDDKDKEDAKKIVIEVINKKG